MQVQTEYLFAILKLIEYIFSAVKVLSNPCVGPFPRTSMSFFLIINMRRRTHIYAKDNIF